MFTRKLITPSSSLSAALLVGLFSHQAAASEEVVVYGAEAAAKAEAQQAQFRSELDEYVRSLNEQIKVNLDQDLKQLTAPKLFLASGETPIRG
jgi:hypothetical protein